MTPFEWLRQNFDFVAADSSCEEVDVAQFEVAKVQSAMALGRREALHEVKVQWVSLCLYIIRR